MIDKWEYCELEIQYRGQLFAQCWIYKADGSHVVLPVPKYGNLMAQLGLDGWELTAASSHAAFGQNHSNTISYMFKRPIQV